MNGKRMFCPQGKMYGVFFVLDMPNKLGQGKICAR